MVITSEIQKDRSNVSPGPISLSINDDVQLNSNINLRIDSSEPGDLPNSLMFSSLDTLYQARLQNPSNVLISYLNIISIQNKMEDLKILLHNKVDILAIAETKIDSSFPNTVESL